MKLLSKIIIAASLSASSALLFANTEEYRHWIEQMKEAPRGPFTGVKWFCNDGSVLPPKPYACAKHGGGVQHGQLSEQAVELRNQGYWIANLLAGIDTGEIINEKGFSERFNQLLLERFLITVDDGWIMHKARFYRGAVQEEDERNSARNLLHAMAGNAEWVEQRYTVLRTGVRLLPHGEDTASVQKVRQLAAALAEHDRQFKSLRVKIHGSPDAGDADLVRQYASKLKKGQQDKYLALADEIDRVYQSTPVSELLNRDARIFSRGLWLQKILRDAAKALEADHSPDNRFTVTAHLLADLRDALPRIHSAGARLRVLDLSLAVEAENFNASTELRGILNHTTRSHRLDWMKQAAVAAYGTGLLNKRSLQSVLHSMATLEQDEVALEAYMRELTYLGRIPGWGTQGLRYFFYESMQKLAEIEPLALHFIQDQLRGSPLLFFAQSLDGLSRDANHLAGVKHRLWGEELGVGFHALNPGLAKGTLHTDIQPDEIENIEPDGIYILPETVSDLPPLAGIITAGEGNPLSHVQLLARNLGIPNVTVDEALISRFAQYNDKEIVMAVSPSGLVEISEYGEKWKHLSEGRAAQTDAAIRPDLEKLDLSVREFIDLDQLRAADSGRIVGPKAAKLGELRLHFPGKVSKGVAIPFGLFKETVLDKPYMNTDQSVFDWMVDQYAQIHALPEGSDKRSEHAEKFRAELYEIIMQSEPGDKFKRDLEAAMTSTFGTTNLGVFVRSDTNVEDLAGFTGAGLNLTLPNVIGVDGVLKAINRVWASPFTARAFAWRQSHMEQPQHVYPAVLLLHSVSNDKSGVMVTQDIDTSDLHTISVAVNEGVGGAVDGQSAESLRIDTRTGSVRVLATTTAPWRRQPSPNGGIVKLPASGSDTVLKPGEIKQLIKFARELPDNFPPITDDSGNPAPADIEFGFLDGELHLFQLRPFLQSEKTQGNEYLISMDKALQGNLKKIVDMSEVPK